MVPGIQIEDFVPDAFLNRRFELSHSGHRLLVIKFLEHFDPEKRSFKT